MSKQGVRYFVFDTESVADGQLVARVHYNDPTLPPAEAVARYRKELLEKNGKDFIPYTFQVPVSVVIGKVDEQYRLLDLVALDEPDAPDRPAFRPHVITGHFWRGWEAYGRPTLVTFNGRAFDVPLLELAAFRYGVALPGWFDQATRNYDQPRNRYNLGAHLDLHDVLTNFGATRFPGGLNLAAILLGKPGKMDVEGCMVQDLYEAGKLAQINDYCRCDVLDTYFVFLRTRVLVGRLPLEREQELIVETKQWLEARRQDVPAYDLYLKHWGDWPNPWPAADRDPSVP